MSLTNYNDISRAGTDVDAGFQFQFNCQNCSRSWKSPFKPYRRGQLAGLIYKFAYLFDRHGSMTRASGAVSESGDKRARQAALAEALQIAEQRYNVCPGCEKVVCETCWDGRAQRCEVCASTGGRASQHGRGGSSGGSAGDASGASSARATCPNCQAALDGGRFCAECGFDMASTHKSCPGCGAMCTRAARFCTDCGHGF